MARDRERRIRYVQDMTALQIPARRSYDRDELSSGECHSDRAHSVNGHQAGPEVDIWSRCPYVTIGAHS